jgi:hypothetical protein
LVVAHFTSDSLSPPNGERAGVRGQYWKIEGLLTPALSSIANGVEGEKQIKAPIDFAAFFRALCVTLKQV